MEILPPLTPGQLCEDAAEADPGPEADALDLTEPLPEELAFTPVPRPGAQKRKIDADVQRAFIAALAASGSVRHAARAIGFTATSLYPLRHHPEGGSFARAWDRAVGYGARQVLDTLMDHAINGAPETLLLPDGTRVERRRYNSRTMQWIVAHHFPERYAATDGLSAHGGLSEGLSKLKAKWRKEWEEEQAAKAARPETPDERYRRERREDEVVIEAMTRVMLRRIAELDGKPAKPYKTIEGLTEAEIAALDDAAEQRLNSAKDNAEDDV